MKKISTKVMSLVVLLAVVTFGQGGIPSNGLCAFYPFTGSSNFSDESGNNNNLHGGAIPTTIPDRFGTTAAADSFNMSNWLIASARNLPSLDSNRTLSMWIKPWSINYNQDLLFYGDTTAGKYCKIGFTDEGPYNRLHISNGVSDLSVRCFPGVSTTQPSIVEKSWNHIAFVITKNETKIYTNNRLDTTGQMTGWATTQDSLIIGACKRILTTGKIDVTSNFWGGIDDVSIYNVALSAAQITQLFNAHSIIEPTIVFNNKLSTKKCNQTPTKNTLRYDIQGRSTTGDIVGIQIKNNHIAIPGLSFTSGQN